MLYPGAGAGADNRSLVAIERGLAPWPVRRCEFANRVAGRRGPERPEAAVVHIAESVAAFAAELGVPTARIAVGGRSFGGRMASMAVAGAFGRVPLDVGALVLLSYPLHPPGRPAVLRTGHLADITVPTLAISGERDPFGTPEELARELAVVPAIELVTVPGTHSPADAPVVAVLREWLGTAEGARTPS